jgi:hypothetical protein
MADNKSTELRDALVDRLIKIVKDGVTVVDDEGQVQTVDPAASYLAVAKDYLKSFPPGSPNAGALPTSGELKGALAEMAKPKLPFTPKVVSNG